MSLSLRNSAKEMFNIEQQRCDVTTLAEALLDAKPFRHFAIAPTHAGSHSIVELTNKRKNDRPDTISLQDTPQESVVDEVIRFREVDQAHIERNPLPLTKAL